MQQPASSGAAGNNRAAASRAMVTRCGLCGRPILHDESRIRIHRILFHRTCVSASAPAVRYGCLLSDETKALPSRYR